MDGGDIGAGVRLADRQRVGADHGRKAVADAQLAQQGFSQRGGLVGADRQPVAVAGQPIKRGLGSGVKPGMDGDPGRIMVQQARIVLILGAGGQQGVGGQARIASAQHGAAAVERDQRVIDRVQQRAKAAGLKAGICRRDQIGRGIGQRAVQIENHRACCRACCRACRPVCHAVVTFRQDV